MKKNLFLRDHVAGQITESSHKKRWKGKAMTTLTVLVDPQSKRTYKLNERRIHFDELRRMILKSEGLQALRRTTSAAAWAGLKKMTAKEIGREINAARRGKNRP